jgi:hypothetical protein
MFGNASRQAMGDTRPSRRPWWSRAAAAMVMSLVAAALLVTAGASPGLAVDGYTEVACPSPSELILAGGVSGGTAYFHPTVVDTDRTLDVAFGKLVRNNTSQPAPSTFTVNVSRTLTSRVVFVAESTNQFSQGFSDAVRTGAQNDPAGTTTLTTQFMATLRLSVTQELTEQVQTAVGQSETIAVQPFSEIVGLYGQQAYDFLVNVQTIVKLNSQPGKCFKDAAYPDFQATAHAPTVIDGWEFNEVVFPKIKQVVNPSAGMSATDFQPGTQVEIQSDFFYPPEDEVRVTQGGVNWTLKAGSFGWKDFESEITATLPVGLQVGPAQIRVISDDRVSPPVTIDIQALARESTRAGC